MQKLQEDIYPYLGYKIKMFKAKKYQTSFNKEESIINRVTWIRKMFVQGKIYCMLDNLRFLDKCISELRFGYTKTNTPDIIKCTMNHMMLYFMVLIRIVLKLFYKKPYFISFWADARYHIHFIPVILLKKF